MATTFSPTSVFSSQPTGNTGVNQNKNWWDMPSYNSGKSEVAGFQLPDFGAMTQNQRNAGQGMLANQGAQTGEFLNNYAGAINGQEGMRPMYARLGEELGLPQLKANADQLNATLEAIPQTYNNATRGFDVNANQLSRIVGTKSAAIAPLAQRATTQAQTAQDYVNTQMGLAQQQQAKELLPYQSEEAFLKDRIARETSMFSQANEQEYNGLVAKMNAGVTLNEGEKQRINQLTIAREGYQNAIKLQEMKDAADSKNRTAPAPVNVNGSTMYYDSSSNQWVGAVA